MKRFQQLFFAAALACGVSAGATASAAAFRVAVAQNVPDDIAGNVCTALEEGAHLERPVPERVDWPLPEGGSLADYAAAHVPGGDDALLVVLDDPSCPEVGHFAIADRVAIVNVSALSADAPSPEAADWRLRRMALRAYARLIGVPLCPFPLCVLFPCNASADLDEISRSYCPPCGDAVRDRALEVGMPVLPLQNP